MNLFLKIVASLPILIYLTNGFTVQNTWGSESDGDVNPVARFLTNLMLGDKLPDLPDPNSIISNLNVTKPFNISSVTSGFQGSADLVSGANNLLTSFVNQTRSTIGLVAHHGNFTLIQAALLFTIGCMAAGAATIVLEGLAFRERQTEIELYKTLHGGGHHANGGVSMAYGAPAPPPPSLQYGSPSQHDSYSSAHSDPIPAYAAVPNSYPSAQQPDLSAYYYGATNTRRKRDTGQLGDGSFIQLSKPYRNPHTTRKVNRFHNAFISGSSGGGDTKQRYPSTFSGVFANPASPLLVSTYGVNPGIGYPDSTNYLLLNRLGMKHKHGSSKRGESKDDNDMEYARGDLPLEDGVVTSVKSRSQQHKRKHKKRQQGEEEILNSFGGSGIAYPSFVVNSQNRMRKYWEDVAQVQLMQGR